MKYKSKLICSLIVFISLSFYKIRSETFPHIFYRAVVEYKKDKRKLNEVTLNKLGGDFSEVKHSSKSKKEIYVLIIGESTTRSHMQLYDYYRDTNPKLNKIKDELIIFKDVISPHTHTITSLEKVLTLATHNSPSRKYDGTLIQLFNKAGFKTYWLSNQKPMGIDETTATIISNNCDEQIFVNISNKSSDENILKPFQSILKQSNDKKFIIIHLMGTHGPYSDRYPVSFQKFKSKPVTNFNHEKAYKTINEYDNANLYNDFIIRHIINQLKKTNSKSYALFFSDHGEDVYETIDIACHTETKGTKPMYDIPFILWQSEKFKIEENKFIYDTSRKYSSEDLLHTLSDLSNISFNEFEPSKSILNKKFVPKKRIILNNIDYDILFKEEK
ncbi:sulfatase-like hydrolase/transferase [Tamlana sp. 2201CG12-4]|uniref:sulfatase-like hydrolase/transferase n=1 Tax=Tamlana sp. 2201CG12-4 TaxID=3112582 RepID=UPI002DBBF820|nr:sulfatase-like hydrolase/transferase [Tamlana sp. 2201CG12-4]MEC3907640.1 sulfatase-like hydrolase/transferase [Tamlana sp. 2201CG12-4]